MKLVLDVNTVPINISEQKGFQLAHKEFVKSGSKGAVVRFETPIILRRTATAFAYVAEQSLVNGESENVFLSDVDARVAGNNWDYDDDQEDGPFTLLVADLKDAKSAKNTANYENIVTENTPIHSPKQLRKLLASTICQRLWSIFADGTTAAQGFSLDGAVSIACKSLGIDKPCLLELEQEKLVKRLVKVLGKSGYRTDSGKRLVFSFDSDNKPCSVLAFDSSNQLVTPTFQ